MQYTLLLGPARMKVGMASRGSAGLVAPPVRAPAAAPPTPAAARRASAAARTPRRQRSPPATSSSSPKSSSKRTSPAGRTGEPVRASARRSMRPRGCGDRSKLDEPKWLRRSLFRGWASCASSAHTTSNGKHAAAASDPASSDKAPGAPRQSEEAFARKISKTAQDGILLEEGPMMSLQEASKQSGVHLSRVEAVLCCQLAGFVVAERNQVRTPKLR